MFRILLISIILFSVECVGIKQTVGETFFADFAKGYRELNIPTLRISHTDNFRAIKNEKSISEQTAFFQKFNKKLKTINREKLSVKQKIDYDLIQYEIKLNLERLALEKNFVKNKPAQISDDNILKNPNGKKWYTYLLKRWVDAEITPNEMFDFGLSETKKVKSKIAEIQKRSGMNDEEFYKHINSEKFFYTDVKTTQKAYEKAHQRISKNLSETFPFLNKIPSVKLRRGTNPALVQIPAYYNNQTFYFNYPGKYNRRQVELFYIHEALPGHHYQVSLENILPRSEIKGLFRYSGFLEGWATYVEDIGWEYDAYPDMYSELGKWEWDLVRSVRVSLDVGLNYYGWSNEKALEFWKKHIPNQDEIAMREINRMKRWSAQVITYKYGANRLLKLKEKEQKRLGKDFNLKEFHRKILENGSLPISVLEKHI